MSGERERTVTMYQALSQVDKCKHGICVVKSTGRDKNLFTYSTNINNTAVVKNAVEGFDGVRKSGETFLKMSYLI